ncbi:hypothetical protein GF380_05340 [Candidatus Uhrbacteria bacterium]|nr:hypothetical protein [Candidatus Uhrbacteria bacterium]MBD3284454.1 hypothetical protein [Candidatus Uhrbacteria bacterium]
MQELLTFGYWFSVRAIPFTPVMERVLLVFFGVFVVAGIASYLFLMKRGLTKITKRALSKFAGLLTWTGLVGLLLWFFTYQNVPVFSMRIFYIGWLVWVGLGFYSIYRYLWVTVPAQQKLQEERSEREKWLPKKKK